MNHIKRINELFILDNDQSKPSIFTHTIYRLPNEPELIEIDKCNLKSDQILKGFVYTIVGRGILSENNKKMIIESIEKLCNLFPNNNEYKLALRQAINKYK